MTDINFKPVFEYLDRMFGDLHLRFTSIEAKIRVLQTKLEQISKIHVD